MTQTVNARLAGFTFLLYIAVALPSMMMFDSAAAGREAGEKLANIATNASDVRIAIVLSIVNCFCALVLGVTLYAITRHRDRDLAVLGLACRAGEGVLNGVYVLAMLALLWLGTSGSVDGAAATLGGLLFKTMEWNATVSATFFAVGSTIFSYLLLAGRLVPAALSWLGIVASVPLVIVLPLGLVGVVSGAMGWLFWIPMLLFEVVLAFWLLIRGVRNSPITI